jgi:hypothetical protein
VSAVNSKKAGKLMSRCAASALKEKGDLCCDENGQPEDARLACENRWHGHESGDCSVVMMANTSTM